MISIIGGPATGPARPPSAPLLSQLPPVPPSPSLSFASAAPTNATSYYPGPPLPPPPQLGHATLTKGDLDASQAAYTDLLASAKSYRLALAALSTAASAFASALESCARRKEAYEDDVHEPPRTPTTTNYTPTSEQHMPPNPVQSPTSTTAHSILATSGLHHLVSNHHHILSETLHCSFEVPLADEFERWRAAVAADEATYRRAARAQSHEIQRLEREGVRLQRQRRRDVAGLRAHLVTLASALDRLTGLHAGHARMLMRESQQTSLRVADACCSLVRAEMDLFEGLARKGWAGGGLEDVLERGRDLFAAAVEEDDEELDEAEPALEESEQGKDTASEGKATVTSRGLVSFFGFRSSTKPKVASGDEAKKGGGSRGGRSSSGGGSGSQGRSGARTPKLFSILPPTGILTDSPVECVGRPSRERRDSLRVDTDAYSSLLGATSPPLTEAGSRHFEPVASEGAERDDDAEATPYRSRSCDNGESDARSVVSTSTQKPSAREASPTLRGLPQFSRPPLFSDAEDPPPNGHGVRDNNDDVQDFLLVGFLPGRELPEGYKKVQTGPVGDSDCWPRVREQGGDLAAASGQSASRVRNECAYPSSVREAGEGVSEREGVAVDRDVAARECAVTERE